jgi:hypothetical protein
MSKSNLSILTTRENEALGNPKPEYARKANSKHRSIEQRKRDMAEAQMACAGLSRFDGGPVPTRR